MKKKAKKLTLKEAWEKVARMRTYGICCRINNLQYINKQITKRQARAMRQAIHPLVPRLDEGFSYWGRGPGPYTWPCNREGNRARREFALKRARRCRS